MKKKKKELNSAEKKSIASIFGENAIQKAENLIIKGGTTTNPANVTSKIVINTDVIN